MKQVLDYSTQTASAAEQQSAVTKQISTSITEINACLQENREFSALTLNNLQKMQQISQKMQAALASFKM